MFSSRFLRCNFILCALLTTLIVLHLLVQLKDHPNYDKYRTVFTTSANPERAVLFHHVTGVGFNNQLQEIAILSTLAALSNRTYVYHDLSFRNTFGRLHYAPLTAFVKNVPGNHMKSEAAFRADCIDGVTSVAIDDTSVNIFDDAVRALADETASCVQVHGWLTSWRNLELDSAISFWSHLKPHLPSLEWSDDLTHAIDRTVSHLRLDDPQNYMAIHLRRGDFAEHCTLLSQEHHPFMLWNRLPALHPALPPPTSASTADLYKSCFPTRPALLSKILAARTAHPTPLSTLYILHDAHWSSPNTLLLLRSLTAHLLRAPNATTPAPFTRIITTTDAAHTLPRAEADYAVAIDVALARRAAVFVGNAFSSLSSDVVMFRLADGLPPASVSFW